MSVTPDNATGMRVRVRGLVQGVGFRPTVWRIARDCELTGEVSNDGAGVLISAWGPERQLELFLDRLALESPPLANIERIERSAMSGRQPTGFVIVPSTTGDVQTGVVPDAALCPRCAEEIRTPEARRFGYAFANCTHCGPRFSIIRSIPYDRSRTSMSAFALCAACRAEYESPLDRRFHAQPIACAACGPQLWLETASGLERDGAISRAQELLAGGAIVAIKGLGGFHLACDATNESTIDRLREHKRRERKAFALMARDLAVVERYCELSSAERTALQSPAAPIVLLRCRGNSLPTNIAPGLKTLGFMLPVTPLHYLVLSTFDKPVVMTSGNASEHPPCISNDSALERLRSIADAFLMHDRPIVNRADDSIVRVCNGEPRILRRARGYAPAPLTLPPGFEEAPSVLALGAELKNSFCLLKEGMATIAPHQGDLGNAATYRDYRENLDLFARLLTHEPRCLAVDFHPEYLSTKLGIERATATGAAVEYVQHHHAHLAACLAENGVPLDNPPVLGIALDGIGMSASGQLWGGEFLSADYRNFRRIASLTPVALLGGERAMHEPWRNLYAHLQASALWGELGGSYAELGIIASLRSKPLATLDTMLAAQINCPLASSCGRLFDAVAAAVGIATEHISFEGQAAMMLEASIDSGELASTCGYPFAVNARPGILQIDSGPMWRALFDDLRQGVGQGIIAARFHAGLAQILVHLSIRICGEQALDRVALSGGVFQNAALLEQVLQGFRKAGVTVLTHKQVPSNDGGISLGQAVVAAARLLTSTAPAVPGRS